MKEVCAFGERFKAPLKQLVRLRDKGLGGMNDLERIWKSCSGYEIVVWVE